MNNFQQTYANLHDDQLIALAIERDTLQTEAQEALDTEIAKRGLFPAPVKRRRLMEESKPGPFPASRRSPLGLVGTIGKYIVFMILAKFLFGSMRGWQFVQSSFWVIVLYVIATLSGAGIGGWYRSRPSPNPKVAGFFAWLCLFAWIHPMFGVLIAVMAYRMSPIAARPIRAKWLASIGLVLSLVVTCYAAYLHYMEKNY